MITKVFDVFTQVAEWFAETLPKMTDIFWNATDSELTVLGVLAVASLGISVTLLIFNYVRDLIRFR